MKQKSQEQVGGKTYSRKCAGVTCMVVGQLGRFAFSQEHDARTRLQNGIPKESEMEIKAKDM